MERLQKVIAASGLCSRRKAEELIARGRVRVNGEVVTEPGTKVSGNDTVEVNGNRLEREEKVYYVLHKPKATISSVKDEKGRPTVMDYVPKTVRTYPVGRLDYDTSGILLLTNDGEFANLMLHPRHHVPKTYVVNLQGMLSADDLKKLKTGFNKWQPAKVKIKQKDYTRNRMIFELTIAEGQNHQVKNMMEDLGHTVRRLHRKTFGNLTADDLRPGGFRPLKPHERKQLVSMAKEGKEDE